MLFVKVDGTLYIEKAFRAYLIVGLLAEAALLVVFSRGYSMSKGLHRTREHFLVACKFAVIGIVCTAAAIIITYLP